ncbi:MAG: RagB/SusD family nutrient uptake outer membrane protein [Saprospiraceae bacterium]|nr:RagB/SusD family nutrient uptake outer membrane protein [Saprospiraceae bacterium]
MKNIKYILACFVFLFAACEDNVDITPTDIIVGDASSINSLEAARDFMNGAYIFVPNPVGFGDLGADNAKLAPTNTGQGVFVHNWLYNAQQPQDNWVGQYRLLGNVNTLLQAIDAIEIAPGEEVERDQIKAEALALRAYTLFNLYRFYSPGADASSAFGVVVATTPLAPADTPARGTVGDVLNQINTDIDDAYALFPTDGITQLDLLSKPATAALGARVALEQGNWSDAIDWADDAISLSGKSIASMTEYPLVWRDNSTAGVIFTSLRTPTGYLSTFNRITNADIFYYGSDGLFNSYDDADVRKSFNFMDDGTGQIVTKWPSDQTVPAIDAKLFRVEEMVLIKAEAYANMNMLTEAAGEINDLRDDRIMGYTDISYANQGDALTDILEERRRELAFEGFRFFDLKRVGMGVARDASDCVTAECDLAAGAIQFNLPIPQQEIDSNPNMVQNPGY